ncbi:MAG TPA: hypothetical protein VGQ62_12160 [Chloroflexota bacterium]|nr:hypothetical protein [Chloroflexota bacterium]
MRLPFAAVTLLSVLALTSASVSAEGSASQPGAEGTDSPAIEVAGVQTFAEDARTAGETEPFITNGGFGD